MGRNADVILTEQHPLLFFVYAELESHIQRCRERETENLTRSDKEYDKQIREVDKPHAKKTRFALPLSLGRYAVGDLCLNTGYLKMKKIIPPLHSKQ